ncbi:YozE family protein [Enterococcus massiliensis]|uniref:YozE family protein n=2 Tax=Enterococcus TaxID=1350 RepID=UPI00065DC01D|nr:YozE family protein [Enterococcus massiliensis]
MYKSFYHYLMAVKGPNHRDEAQVFATHASHDIQFPKQSTDYHELSTYLEMSVDYLPTMDIFDRLWERYLEENKKKN